MKDKDDIETKGLEEGDKEFFHREIEASII
jgi:hypothetical protein